VSTNAKQSKAQRKEAARAAAAELKAKQEAAERRTKRMIFGGLAAVVVVLLALVVFLFVRGDGSPSIDSDLPLAQVTDVPSTARPDGGILLGPGGVAGGAAVPGVPELGIYLDYRCSFCNSFELANLENMRSFMDDGIANVVLYPVGILGPNSVRIAAASAFVASNAPQQWFDYHLAIFEIGFADTPAFGNADLADAAIAVGVPSTLAEAIRNGDAYRTYAQWVTSASQAFLTADGLENANGGRGTPTVTLDGVRQDANWFDPEVLPAIIAEASGTQADGE
jgi:protein-disulfide isomerase